MGANPSADDAQLVGAAALARMQRRRWAVEALEFERSREGAIQEQLEELSAELEGPRVDAEIFARLSPADVEVLRAAAGEGVGGDVPAAEEEYGEELAQAWQEDDEIDPEAERQELLEELARLRGEIEHSRSRQQAFERYLRALSAAAEGA